LHLVDPALLKSYNTINIIGYFLWVYAILRSIPNKLAGVAAIGLVFLSLFLLPFLHTSPSRSAVFRPLHELFFWTFIADCFLLTWIGQEPVEQPYIFIGQLATIWFFLYLLLITPFVGLLEHQFCLYNEERSELTEKKTVMSAAENKIKTNYH
jgi:quinol-cytochrome oxidoreductase complex cytochrome b subunit